jgi:hypothetical protein
LFTIPIGIPHCQAILRQVYGLGQGSVLEVQAIKVKYSGKIIHALGVRYRPALLDRPHVGPLAKTKLLCTLFQGQPFFKTPLQDHLAEAQFVVHVGQYSNFYKSVKKNIAN